MWKNATTKIKIREYTEVISLEYYVHCKIACAVIQSDMKSMCCYPVGYEKYLRKIKKPLRKKSDDSEGFGD